MHNFCITEAIQRAKHLLQQAIITPLGVDEMAEWHNNFMLVPKPNGKVRLCLDPLRINQVTDMNGPLGTHETIP